MLHKAKRNILAAIAVAGAGVIALPQVHGATISSNNSTMTFQTTGSGVTPYITGWTIDGINQYVGPNSGEFIASGVGSLSEGSITSLPISSSSFSGNVASVTYQGNGFTLNVQDTLLGGSAGSGASSIAESITVNNTSSSTLDFELGQIVQLTLDGNPGGTSTLSMNSSTNTLTETNAQGTNVTEVVLPAPIGWSLSSSGQSGLTSGADNPGPFIGGQDVSALVWQNTLAVGGTEIYSITETATGVTSTTSSVVPLPSSAESALATLMGLGAIGIARRARRTA